MSVDRKHVTSSLSCSHLPNVDGTTGLTLTVSAFDAAVRFHHSLHAVGSTSSDGCFDWELPVAGEFTSGGASRTRIAHVGDAATLSFHFLFRCNKSLDAIRLGWRTDLRTANSSSASSYSLEFLLPTAAAENSTNSTGISRCSELDGARNVSDDVTVACHGVPLLPGNGGGCAYLVDVGLPVVSRRHAGAYSAAFVGGDDSVSYHVELVVPDHRGGGGTEEDLAPFALRLSTCSNETWVGADDDTATTTEYRLRQLVPRVAALSALL